MPPGPHPKTLAPVRPNVGIARNYRRRIEKLVEEMHRSVLYWLRAAWRRRPPELHRVHRGVAQDASPARNLADEVTRLATRWKRRFARAAEELAAYFARAVAERSDRALASILKRGGFTVKFRMSRAVNDVVQATIAENVGLIKSIPERYLADVEGAVMRSVQRGRDLESLTEELQNKFHATRRRAELIARDQNNKATATIVHTRHAEIGITKAVWVHSTGGRQPRPTHVKAGRDKIEFDVKTGWFDPAEQRYVLPGELINCRCVSRPVVPGFS